MTDNKLFKPSNSIEKQKLELSVSLKDKLNKLKVSLKNTLLLDLSGSMEEYTADNISKREALESIVKGLPQGIRKFAFDYDCEEIIGNEFPRKGGGTAMHRAFNTMHERGLKEIILITDGIPDSETAALSAAEGLKIEIIYIGPAPAPDFLDKLARGTGGKFITVDMIQAGSTLELENKIKGLLGG